MNTLALICCLATASQQSDDVTVRVDPRLEVLALTAWLAGKYPTPTDSAYKLRTWNHFQKFRNHPAVVALRNAKNMYTDFTELGVSLTDIQKPTLTGETGRWREILGAESYDGFFAALPDFVQKTGFVRFFQSNQKEFDRACAQFKGVLAKEKTIETMESFYRYGTSRPRPKFEVFLEPLNSWGAHAIVNKKKLEQGDNSEPVRYQIGNWSGINVFLDGSLNFESTSSLAETAWHEGSHVYIAPVFYANTAAINAQERLFNREMLVKQNISTWEYCLNENVVRAITAVLVKLTKGEKLYLREVTVQTKQAGFIYTGTIAEWILKDYVGNASYRTFDDFFPVILERLKTLPDYQVGQS